ncbi:tRNA uracil 4-sulfurtransferase ThiI [Paenibacillus lutrae]|uniref:Probable tRNA sulfurtransferase n=1 Tax=Paenibacillus lutrae TaxID=2078573 RepID=A0A7X3FGL6_9BACL|nr:tRNA uracil 4-sulfurtransferase ThiI [Paenibacillus lutrae]MVO99400.1 tRNA 4-thiouridine(8) synthase ThiI [Paenibacillus lutrae]
MKPDLLLVRFGEMMLKGKNRSRFEKKVIRQLRDLLMPFPQVKLVTEYGRVYIDLADEPLEDVSRAVGKVFGIDSYSPVYTAPSDAAAIQELAAELMREIVTRPQTFKVEVRRVDKSFPHDTFEMNRLVGGAVLRACPQLSVDVRKPETTLRVELREGRALLFVQSFEGAGGYPLGTNGKGVLLLSGGIDSPVAGWQAMRRGLELEAVHFHSYPYTSERAKEKVIDLARKLSAYSGGSLKLHLVSFTEVQTSIYAEYKDNLLVTLLRRAMYRIAERIAEREKALALVTGESLGQVASQTLPSLNAIGRAVSLPVLQPLITTDKHDIIRMAEQIDTYNISILPYEDCCTLFLPPSPSTNPNLRVVEAIERKFPQLEEWINRTVEQAETIVVRADEEPARDSYF